MKKFFSMILLTVLLSGCAIAEPLLSPDKTADAINNLISSTAVDGVDQTCYYNEDKNLFFMIVVSDDMIDSATAAASGKSKKKWTACKETAYSMYDTVRSLLDTYGHEDAGFYVFLDTGDDKDAFTFYAVGEEDGGECSVFLDMITNDSKPIKPKKK